MYWDDMSMWNVFLVFLFNLHSWNIFELWLVEKIIKRTKWKVKHKNDYFKSYILSTRALVIQIPQIEPKMWFFRVNRRHVFCVTRTRSETRVLVLSINFIPFSRLSFAITTNLFVTRSHFKVGIEWMGRRGKINEVEHFLWVSHLKKFFFFLHIFWHFNDN